MSRWFGKIAKPSAPMLAEEEDQHLLEVERALLKLLNDDVAEADKMLKKSDSAFHHLGRGISSFISSVLGAEKGLIKDATAVLRESENKSWEYMKKAQREPMAFQSSIYPPGTEYLLCYAISQLTSAICLVMSGSVTQAVTGFYKMRKAYLTLDGIMNVEADYLKKMTASKRSSMVSRAGHPRHSQSVSLGQRDGFAPPASNEKDSDADSASVANGSIHDSTLEDLPSPTRVESKLLDIDPADVGITSHTDIFIHSGTRLCYGILLLVFSMIENPVFNKILYIVGFKGDRERGTRYLWQAARFDNFNSAIAGITLLSYYDTLVESCDILPTDAGADDDLSGYPRAHCKTLLIDMRKRYPDSKFWKLEEARMHSSSRNLPEAVKILAANSNSNMKQIATINMFEMALTTMYIHDYELCAKSWIQCAELSSWSPTLYAYITGATFLELYRNNKGADATLAESYKNQATEYFRRGPPMAGRQKVMSKQLPFDMYIVRKVSKWEARAKDASVDLVDAIGISPLAEMIYFWGGAKKQAPAELEQSLAILGWERTGNPEMYKEDLEERVIQAVLKACMFRNLGRFVEARNLLSKETSGVLIHDKHLFKGPLKDDWMLPSAYYEMAAIDWAEKDLEGMDQAKKLASSETWIDFVKHWPEQYILDTRMAVKISMSLFTLKRHRRILQANGL